MLANTSTVYAQEIKKETNNRFVIDSLGLKEYSTLVYQVKSIPELIESYKNTIKEKDNEISLLNFKIDEYKQNEIRFDNAMTMRDENDRDKAEIAKQKLRKVKWQRNTAYIGSGVAIILSILIVSK